MNHFDQAALIARDHIVLAREPSFTIGRIRVDPSTRSIHSEHGSEIIEPRMMQVLVALARKSGSVVTRDELLDQCWDAHIVGDDAVNRVLWRLRQLCGKLGADAFRIETVPRVGYRLVAGSPPMTRASDRARNLMPGISRRTLGIGAASVAAATVLVPFAFAGHQIAHKPLPEAKLYFDRAMTFRGQASFAQTEQSIAYLKEAVRLDPEYAEAWGALSMGYRCKLDWFAPRPDAAQLKIAARSAARRALALDERNVDARASLLLIEPMFGNWYARERGLRALLLESPDHRDCMAALSSLLIETGQLNSAIALLSRLAKKEPLSLFVHATLADTLLCAGRLEETEQQLEVDWRVWPRNVGVWWTKILFLLVSGQQSDALAFASDPRQQPMDPTPVVGQLVKITMAYVTGSPDDRERAAAAIRAFAAQSPAAMAIAAMESAFIGEVDLAFDIYQGYFLDRGSWKAGQLERRFTGGLFRPETEVLRKDSRFRPLLDQIGLTRYWRDAGITPDFLRA